MQKISLKNIQFFRYVMVGGLATLIHILVAYLYLYYIDYSLFLSNTIAFFIAFAYSYNFQTLYVFRSKISFINFVKFLIVQLIIIATSMLIIDNISIYNYYIKTVFILIIITPASFLLHKFWTFN
jgi:putative flippase GtrA